MKVFEIPDDGLISLKLNKEGKSTVVSAKIKKNTEKALFLEPIIINGKELNLADEKDLVIDLIYENQKDKPLIWRNIAYKMVVIDGRKIILMSDSKDGVHYNRRETFRLDMDVKGVLNKNESVIVHDISTSGISFYTPKENKKTVGDEIHVKFVGGYEDINVAGQIVREVEKEDRNLYGCEIKKNIQVEKFMVNEQRRRISHKKK